MALGGETGRVSPVAPLGDETPEVIPCHTGPFFCASQLRANVFRRYSKRAEPIDPGDNVRTRGAGDSFQEQPVDHVAGELRRLLSDGHGDHFGASLHRGRTRRNRCSSPALRARAEPPVTYNSFAPPPINLFAKQTSARRAGAPKACAVSRRSEPGRTARTGRP